MSEEKTCGNCREIFDCQPCEDIHHRRIKHCNDCTYDHKENCKGCDRWGGTYDYLESQLAKYEPRMFDPEKRETWPEIGKDVVVWHDKSRKHIAKIEECIGFFHWLENKCADTESVWNIASFKWWSELPGGEGK